MGDLSERVGKAQTDAEERNALLGDYIPFIMSCASRQAGKYIVQGVHDEASVAMMAFDEAIDQYDLDRGGFLSFAKKVINRRLIDYYRKQNSRGKVLQMDFAGSGDEGVNHIDNLRAEEIYRQKSEEAERRWEIEIYKKELQTWGIAFEDLIRCSPKHDRLRQEYKELAVYITREDDLLDELMRTHRLPIKKISENRKIPRKKLERGRIYILSMIVILTGDYRFIREYIKWR